MNTQHVPAWKRLGLKLKHVNQVPINTNLHELSNGSGKKRKVEPSTSTSSGEDNNKNQLQKARVDDEIPHELNNDEADRSPGKTVTTATKRKKSVTFTPDTKVEDGDSANTIQFWVPDVPGSTYQGVSDPSRMFWPADPIDPPEKVKKFKKPKNPADSRKSRKATAALDYLDQYHHHRSLWKFNKNHETWILKHVLSTEQIPQAYDITLASYLQGLKSTGARQRLVQQARRNKSALDQDPDNDNIDLRQKLLQIIDMDNIAAKDGNVRPSWLDKLSRERLVLLSLDEDAQTSLRQVQEHDRKLPRVKKNKSRTSRVDLESSSSSGSSSESESDSPITSNASSQPQGLVVIGKERDATSTETSSDSSTESGDSDTDEDSDSET